MDRVLIRVDAWCWRPCFRRIRTSRARHLDRTRRPLPQTFSTMVLVIPRVAPFAGKFSSMSATSKTLKAIIEPYSFGLCRQQQVLRYDVRQLPNTFDSIACEAGDFQFAGLVAEKRLLTQRLRALKHVFLFNLRARIINLANRALQSALLGFVCALYAQSIGLCVRLAKI